MHPTKILKIAKSSLCATVALTGLGYGVVVASSVEGYVAPQQAAKAEKKAAIALAMKKFAEAIKQGEQAVAGDPRNADYRMLLGQANLSAGRFASAETLFNDTLQLDPANARAALNLALAQTAQGHAAEARATLEIHHEHIAAADYGLALALAGDPSTAVRALESAARTDSATAKTRQNLALAYALAGRWDEAKVTAAQDLSPDLVDQRMSEWAQIAHPKAAWEQVASVLHVTPANDPGLPYRLALNTGAAASMAATMPPPAASPAVAASAPVAQAESMAPRFETTGKTGVTAALNTASTAPQPAPSIEFAPRQEVAQVVPSALHDAPTIHAETSPAKRFIAERARVKTAAHALPDLAHPTVKAVAHKGFKTGRYVVQIGAYQTVALAQWAWSRDLKKFAALRAYDPAQSRINAHSVPYYRLAVSGFSTRTDAGAVCSTLRAAGNHCFVRTAQGDQLASWIHPQGASRMLAHATHPAPKLAAKPAAHAVAKAAAKAIVPAIAKVAPKPAPHAQVAAKSAVKPAAKPVAAPVARVNVAAGGQLAARR
jgi:Flp pilus assembly protein TadD